MTTPRRLVALVVAVVALQLVIPGSALLAPDKPNRLGWQMYSGLGDRAVEVFDARGVPLDFPWSEVLAKQRRLELNWTHVLPEHLCTVFDEPTITVAVGSERRPVEC